MHEFQCIHPKQINKENKIDSLSGENKSHCGTGKINYWSHTPRVEVQTKSTRISMACHKHLSHTTVQEAVYASH